MATLLRTVNTTLMEGGLSPTSDTSGTSGKLPTHDDTALVNWVNILFQKARAQRRPLVQRWNRNYRILRNRTWLTSRPSWLPSPEVPEIFPIVSALVGWMTDQRPTFDVVSSSLPNSAFNSYYSSLAADLKTVLQSVWQVHRYDTEIEKSVWDAWLCGTSIFKTGWDTSLDKGLGNAILRRVDPYTFYPDPQATSMETSNYFIEARTMSLQELERRWPGSSSLFRSGGVTIDIDMAPTNLDATSGSIPMANPGAIPPGVSPRYGRPGLSRVHVTDDPGVTVLEAWVRQHEVWKNSDGDNMIYDYWRVIVTAGNHVLMDERADDLWDHGSHPYERYCPQEMGGFWGEALVEYLSPAQLSINRLLASLQLNVELVGNPVFLESNRSGIGRQRITNQPGTRLTVNDSGTPPQWLAPPPVHPMMMELVTFYIGEMERISGLSAIVRGMQPGGRQAASVLDSIQEAAFVRVRLALRNLEWALRSAGEKIASIIVENYTVPRMTATIGPQGTANAMFLKASHFYVPTANGIQPMRFQLLVNAGSSLPTSRQARAQEADTLFAMGALDIRGVLDAHDYPNREAIIQRVQAMQAAGQFQPPGARQRSGH